MSAYAALRTDAASNIGSPVTPLDVDDNALQYVKGSDDEFSDEDDTMSTVDVKLGSRANESNSSTPALSKQRIFQSNFLPSETNLQFDEDSVSVRLECGDFIMIRGMFKLQILHGNVRINNCYELNAGNDRIYTFFTTDLHALPIIANVSAGTREKDSIARIKLSNYFTGFNDTNHKLSLIQVSPESNTKENIFKRFTFQIIIQSGSHYGLYVDDSWISYFASSAAISAHNLIVIGNKNAGKSTFCKSLLDYLRFEKKQSVVVMDLDPGQSDNSSPFCMSLSVQLPQGICTTSGFVFDKHEEYYGFNSPIDAPSRYLEVTRKLYTIYHQKFKQKGMRLVINTPGWIKGYGKTLLQEVTSIVNPSDLILLTNNLSIESEENQSVLQSMNFATVYLLPGVFQLPSSSPSQFRIDNKLMYFHQKGGDSFDFSHYLLSTPPKRISYQVGTSEQGVYGVSILNYKVDANFDFRNIPLLLSSLIWGVYSVQSSCDEAVVKDSKYNLYPNLIKSKGLELVLGANSQFLGLLIIHSINPCDNYLNVYTPPIVLQKIEGALKSKSKIVLLRGEGSIPPIELMYPQFHQTGTTMPLQRPRVVSSKAHVPYINTKGRTKIGGIWKVRRNILRRSHRR